MARKWRVATVDMGEMDVDRVSRPDCKRIAHQYTMQQGHIPASGVAHLLPGGGGGLRVPPYTRRTTSTRPGLHRALEMWDKIC